MSSEHALLRTLLFAPANDPRKTRKLPLVGADVFVLDLEDAVAESAKDVARALAVEALDQLVAPGAAVRVNGVETPHFERDIEAVVRPGLTRIVVPKVETLEVLRTVDDALKATERARALEAPVRVIAALETAPGIANAEAIAARAPARVERLLFGSIDYCASTGIEPSRDEQELLYARSRVVNAAAVHGGGPALDGPQLALQDAELLHESSVRSRRLGFGGRVVIHPDQVMVVNAAFSALEPARHAELLAIVAAFEGAVAGGVSSLRVGDTFVDYPVYEHACALLREHARATRDRQV